MITHEQIKGIALTIAQKFNPQKIILFGSYAGGTPKNDSDIDLLVILPHEGSAADKAAEIRLSLPDNIAIDLLVRTSGKIKERLGMNDYFIMEALKGDVLYEAVGG